MCDISFGFISSSRTSSHQTEIVFWDFLFKSIWGEMIKWWRGYSCYRKAGRNFKSNVSGFIKDFFVLKVEIDFRKLIRKSREGLSERGFGIICFMIKILTIMWYHRKLWCLGCNIDNFYSKNVVLGLFFFTFMFSSCFILVPPPPILGRYFISWFWNVLFCLYCSPLSRNLLSVPLFTYIFSSITSSCVLRLVWGLLSGNWHFIRFQFILCWLFRLLSQHFHLCYSHFACRFHGPVRILLKRSPFYHRQVMFFHRSTPSVWTYHSSRQVSITYQLFRSLPWLFLSSFDSLRS